MRMTLAGRARRAEAVHVAARLDARDAHTQSRPVQVAARSQTIHAARCRCDEETVNEPLNYTLGFQCLMFELRSTLIRGCHAPAAPTPRHLPVSCMRARAECDLTAANRTKCLKLFVYCVEICCVAEPSTEDLQASTNMRHLNSRQTAGQVQIQAFTRAGTFSRSFKHEFCRCRASNAEEAPTAMSPEQEEQMKKAMEDPAVCIARHSDTVCEQALCRAI